MNYTHRFGLGYLAVLFLGHLLVTGPLPTSAEQASYVAIEFNGSAKPIVVSHHDALNPGMDNWTCAFWVKQHEEFAVRHNKFMGKRDGPGATGGFYIGSQFAPACSEQNRQTLNFMDHIPIGVWTHIAVQIDRDNNMIRAFVNGELAREVESRLVGPVNAESDFVIGGDSTGGRLGNRCLMRDLRIWRGPLLRVEDVQAVISGDEDVQAEALVAHWMMNDGSGDQVRDRVGDHHGRIEGEADWVLHGILDADLPDTMDIAPGQAVTFGPVTLSAPRGTVSYQWFLNGNPIAGATDSRLDIPFFTADHVGAYHVTMNDDNPYTPLPSSTLRIEWPLWEKEPNSVSAQFGDSATLGPVALYAPHGTVTYQWYRNGIPVTGATGNTLVIESVTEEDLGRYHVRVDDELQHTPVDSRPVYLREPDWPMWQFDAARSGNSPMPLADTLHLQWARELPSPRRAWPFQWDDRGKLDFDVSYAPIVLGERLFVPSNVTDSLSAYHIEDGRLLWRFHTDGPVRLAPAAWRDRVFFTSDDGHLYCVSTESGELLWKHAAGPTDQRFLGNERIINFWAARGGPVVKDETVYYAAGIWPLHGVFIYALDALTGEVQWVNDTISSEYVSLPHGGAYGYGGLSPQGYLAADDERLIVSAGRGQSPVFIDRATGQVSAHQFRGRKGHGHYAVNALSESGLGYIPNPDLDKKVQRLQDQLEGTVFYRLAARDRLFVVTEEGHLYCFGPELVEPIHHNHTPTGIAPQTDQWRDVVQQSLAALDEEEGYALLLGAGSGDLLRELLLQSELHVVVVESDSDTVQALRSKLVSADLYGRRAAVIETDPATFNVQPYLFSLVMSEDAQAAGLSSPDKLAHALARLRPYGGIAHLKNVRASSRDLQRHSVDAVDARIRGRTLVARRSGPLPGAAQWTHQYRDPTHNIMSPEHRVRLPVGILWFGGPNNHDILPRHSGGPRPQVVGGRIFYLGVDTAGARCVYTGRRIWSREFPGIGFHATNMELEERWREGEEVYMTNIPGTTYVGSPIVSLPDAVYIRYEGAIHKLDPATGDVINVFALPGRHPRDIYDDPEAIDWGHMHAQGDALVVSLEPHLFEDQRIGWTQSYTATSSRRLAVLDRHTGELLWEREAAIGFRHNAIISHGETLYLIDGLSEEALEYRARRGMQPDQASSIMALNLATGEERWSHDSDVFGTFLMYVADLDILIEGGSVDLRRPLQDEPRHVAARQGVTGEILWTGGNFVLPGAAHGEKLIPGRPGPGISILTGEPWQRVQPLTGETTPWRYHRAYGCNTLSASPYFLFFRSGYASYFDLANDTGTGNFSGFRSGCTANMVAADGVISALDYTRTCTCSYAMQTSLAMIHMPDDPHIEQWTRYDAAPPNPAAHGLNLGAPGRRVDATDAVWFDHEGHMHRHPSAIQDAGDSIPWVLSSAHEGEGIWEVPDLLNTLYTVRLHFAELRPDVAPGQRVFDVWINGEKVLEAMDIAAQTGGPFRGLVHPLEIPVSGHALTIELKSVVGSAYPPIINGIELKAHIDQVALVSNSHYDLPRRIAARPGRLALPFPL